MADSKSRSISNLPAAVQPTVETPTIGTATNVGTGRAYNNGAATVTVTNPTGGRPVSYTATSTPGSFTATSATSPLTVTGLASGTAYTFAVTGTSFDGVTTSASSASNSITATTVPQAPTIGTVTVTNSTTVSIPFTAGATGGSTITSYTATSSPSVSLSVSGTTSPLTVTGTFATNQAYTFTIAAVNANGTSTSSSASNSVTPVIPYYAGYLVTSSSIDYGYSTAFDSSGNQYIGGVCNNGSGGTVAILAKYNSSGTLQWQRTLSVTGVAAASQIVYINGITVDSSGNPHVCGQYRNSSLVYCAWVAKYNSSGTFQWQRDFSHTSNGMNFNAVTVDSSGNVYAAGTSNSFQGQSLLVKYNSSGTYQWYVVQQRSFNGSYADTYYGVTTDSSGNVYAAGYAWNPNGVAVSTLVKFNPSNGAVLSERWFGPTSSGTNYGQNICVDSSNNVYVVGYFVNGSSGYNTYIRKYNSSLTLQWERSLASTRTASTQYDLPYAVSTDNSNNVYVGISSTNTSGGTNGVLVKYNSSGTLQWQRTLADQQAAASQRTNLYGTASDSSSNVYLTGRFYNTSNVYRTLVNKVPTDGTKTGTWTIDATNALTYASSSYTDAATSWTWDVASTLNPTSSNGADAAGSLTDAAGAATSVTVLI